MTNEDFSQLQQLAVRLPEVERFGVFSPIREGEKKLFPHAIGLPRRKWDINKPSRMRFDILLAANVFMYAPDPAKWFQNVLSSCRYFILQDIVRRKRSEQHEFGDDCARYAVGGHIPRVEHFFDLGDLGNRLLSYKTYFGGVNPNDDDPLHVIAVIKGDLARPVIRIDDYPTGIRPVLEDLTPIHDVIQKFESAGLDYHLGIVPALVTNEMFDFLNGLRHMIPVVHGYDHSYATYAPILESAADPYNERTVGVFNEFKGQSYEVILERLSRGKHLLEEKLGKSVDAYIPPCNIADRKTAKALEAAGYSRYFSEKRIPGSNLPWIKSDFYGISPDFEAEARPQVSSFHTTWEWDVHRRGDASSLDRVLMHLVMEKELEDEIADSLKTAFGRQ